MLEQLKKIQFSDILRQKSLENAIEIGYPIMKQEEWKYTYYNKILQNNFIISKDNQYIKNFNIDKIPYLKNAPYRLIFIDGEFSADLSIYPNHPKFNFHNNANIELSNTNDFLLELNNAIASDGIFIDIKDNFIEEKNICIYYISTIDQHIFNLKNKIKIGKNVQVKFTEYFINPNNTTTYYNIVSTIAIDENTMVNWEKIQDGNEHYYLTDNTLVQQDKASVYTVNTVTISGNIVRNNLKIDINGEHAESNLNGLYMLHSATHCDNRTQVNHNQPNTASNELYKGILSDNATGIFNGKIVVAPEAQKTNAFQSNKNLLLSADAHVYIKPQLEIFADDVKCSHGATSSQIEDSELFYLQARGIGKEVAKKLLTMAFAGEILEKILENNRMYIEDRI